VLDPPELPAHDRSPGHDPQLKTLAQLASGASMGCSWCVDHGYFAPQSEGHPVDKLKDVPRWRDSGAFTPIERDVLAYAER
jgi:alkylhydroperoxidase family enzyme